MSVKEKDNTGVPHNKYNNLRKAINRSRETCKVRDLIEAEESTDPGSQVRFPLTEMFDFARMLYLVDTYDDEDRGILSVRFDHLGIHSPARKGMYAVSMHCMCSRFEKFMERHNAVITSVSSLSNNTVHVVASIPIGHMNWLDVECVYYRHELQQCESSVFEDVDTIHDLFMIYAALKDWSVKLDGQ